MKIAVVTARGSGGEEGGAERFYEALVNAFGNLGHQVEEIAVTVDEPDFDRIKRNYLACYDLDLARFDVVVSTKAPTWMLRHPRHVCYLVHTIRAFYDMFEDMFPKPWPELEQQRELIHKLDTLALASPRCRQVFTIGSEVSARLMRWNGIPSTVLHPPLWRNEFSQGPQGDYFFLPGRLHEWKRVELLIDAFRKVNAPVKLKIAGTGPTEIQLRAQAAGHDRIEFLGRISDSDLITLYSGALAVPFVPKREDYGYVTLEAFASGKPVITCEDSGEAASIVLAARGGHVVSPTAEALAGALETVARERTMAAEMGQRGLGWVSALSWERVANALLQAAGT